MSTWCIVPRKVGNIEPKICVNHLVLIQEISEVGENLDTILIGIHQSCLKLTDSIDYIKIIGFYLCGYIKKIVISKWHRDAFILRERSLRTFHPVMAISSDFLLSSGVSKFFTP